MTDLATRLRLRGGRSAASDNAAPRGPAAAHTSRHRPEHARVVTCYDFFDRLFPIVGLYDLTDGLYAGHRDTPYELAQHRQIDWLLDQLDCGPGVRILDIGCGYGTLLERARDRGAEATGITISPPQVRHGRRRGLDVRLLDYRDLDDGWTGRFDGIVANGSLEHFVHPADVLAGRGDAIYRALFATCRRVIDPASSIRRVVTTTIHRHEHSPRLNPQDLKRGPRAFRWGTAKFHYAMLQRGFGGFYPEPGQLARCAAPFFDLVGEVDGTTDYHWTSEDCFRRVKRALCQPATAPKLWGRLLPLFFRHPRQTATLCLGLFVAASWQWQFRGADPPTRLLRQTWQCR